MKGILPDVHLSGLVEDLVHHMKAEPWAEFWNHLRLTLLTFEDVGLSPNATDLEIWQRCQSQRLIFITNNRNEDSPDSLEATIRLYNTPDCLPVFTIADVDKFRKSRDYAERVLEKLYDYLLDMNNVCGAGRLFLP